MEEIPRKSVLFFRVLRSLEIKGQFSYNGQCVYHDLGPRKVEHRDLEILGRERFDQTWCSAGFLTGSPGEDDAAVGSGGVQCSPLTCTISVGITAVTRGGSRARGHRRAAKAGATTAAARAIVVPCASAAVISRAATVIA